MSQNNPKIFRVRVKFSSRRITWLLVLEVPVPVANCELFPNWFNYRKKIVNNIHNSIRTQFVLAFGVFPEEIHV
jgi:hypothetical protein